MARAIIYPRVSTAKQSDGLSLDEQERVCREHCEVQKHIVVAVIPEVGSGHDTYEERPELGRIREMFRRGEADVLVCWQVDRSAREATDNLLLLREVTRAGGYLEYTKEGVFKDTPMDKTRLTLYSMSAEEEWLNLQRRTQPLIRRRALGGKPLTSSNAPYGYVYVGKKRDALVIDEEPAQVVVRMYEAVVRGDSLRRIAMSLTREGVPTPSKMLQQRGELSDRKPVGAVWTWRTVREIVTNETYSGRRVAYRRKTVEKVSKKTGKRYHQSVMRTADDPARIVQECPAIVSVDMWNLAQRQMQRNKQESVRNNRHAELALLRSGYAYCGHCGTLMSTAMKQGHMVYRCQRRLGYEYRPGKVCPGGAFHIQCAEVDGPVWEMAEAVARDAGKLEGLIRSRREFAQDAIDSAQHEGQNVAEEMKDQLAQQANLVQRIARESDDTIVALYRQELLQVNETLKRLRNKALVSETLVKALRDIQAEHAEANRLFLEKHGAPVTYQEKRQVLALLRVKVKLYRADSDYAKKNGKRYEFTFAVDGDDDSEHRPKARAYGADDSLNSSSASVPTPVASATIRNTTIACKRRRRRSPAILEMSARIRSPPRYASAAGQTAPGPPAHAAAHRPRRDHRAA
jgi:site-specific DNA recombinase